MRTLGRFAAVVAAVSAATHLVISVGPAGGTALNRIVLLVMAAGCIVCAPALWRRPAARVWGMTIAMYLLMVLAHPRLGHSTMGQMGPVTGHDGGHGMAGAVGTGWNQAYAAMHLIPYVQFAFGALALAVIGSQSLSVWDGDAEPVAPATRREVRDSDVHQ